MGCDQKYGTVDTKILKLKICHLRAIITTICTLCWGRISIRCPYAAAMKERPASRHMQPRTPRGHWTKDIFPTTGCSIISSAMSSFCGCLFPQKETKTISGRFCRHSINRMSFPGAFCLLKERVCSMTKENRCCPHTNKSKRQKCAISPPPEATTHSKCVIHGRHSTHTMP